MSIFVCAVQTTHSVAAATYTSLMGSALDATNVAATNVNRNAYGVAITGCGDDDRQTAMESFIKN